MQYSLQTPKLWRVTWYTFAAKKINKIIYTSSASVYNLSKLDLYETQLSNREIYSITKYLSEKILIDFSNRNRINLTVARLFNMYGGKDNFSIINTITSSYLKKKLLQFLIMGNQLEILYMLKKYVKYIKNYLVLNLK